MRLLVFFLVFLLPGALPAQSIEPTSYLGKKFLVFRVPQAGNALSLHLQNEKGEPYKSFNALGQSLKEKGRQLVFAMNGGMYQPDFSAVGLFIENGKTRKGLNLANGTGNFTLKPNGVFAWTNQQAWVMESLAFRQKKRPVLWATQSGPMLVINGKIHPAFNKESLSKLIRNGVGVSGKGDILFCLSEEPVSFYEMASLFKDKLGCANALYLDGNISGIYSKELGRNDRFFQYGPLIALTEKSKD